MYRKLHTKSGRIFTLSRTISSTVIISTLLTKRSPTVKIISSSTPSTIFRITSFPMNSILFPYNNVTKLRTFSTNTVNNDNIKNINNKDIITELNKSIDDLQMEIDEIRGTLDESQSAWEELESENDDLRKQIKKLEEKYDDLSSDMDIIQARSRRLQREIDDLIIETRNRASWWVLLVVMYFSYKIYFSLSDAQREILRIKLRTFFGMPLN